MPTEHDPTTLPLVRLAERLRHQARDRHHRRLLTLSGESAWCHDQAAVLAQALQPADSLWVGRDAPAGIPSLSNPQALQRLGGELDLLIYDAHAGFDADAFGALSGTLRGGGLLLLLTPPLDAWSRFDDPEHARIAVAGYPPEAVGGGFLGRLARLLRADVSNCLVTPERMPALTDPEPRAIPAPPQPTDDACRTDDQRQAVEAVHHVVAGHRRRPLVLISDRGRGKSAALGIAAARLMLEGKRRILVTAPRRRAVDSLFEQAGRLLGVTDTSSQRLAVYDSELRYSAPDHLLAEPQVADLLLVDEAAAIPTPLLEGLLATYARVVFATTVHGYEGTGRGFQLRFRRHLDRQTPQWQALQLREPIRWAANDPLEPLVFRLLALEADPAPDALLSDASIESVSPALPERRQLPHDESVLSQIFGLLVLAHYRTTPLDFRLLLDAPNLQPMLLRHRDAVAGVALLAAEGGFDKDLSEEIWAGRRRPRGHLLAQSLAAHVGIRSAPRLRGLRIMRIAIHPAAQRRGLGSLLAGEIRRYAQAQGFDYLGTSFGATGELIDFWRSNGLRPVRLGLRSGGSSGGHSVMMIEPLSDAGSAMADEAAARFGRLLPALLDDPLRSLSAELAGRLLVGSRIDDGIRLSPQEWLDLAGFAFAQRAYESCLTAIGKLSLIGLAQGVLATDETRLLVMRVVQKRPWKDCAESCGLSGRNEAETWLRGILGRLFRRFADNDVWG
ncbi:MAG: GNAT family N-acetyltransferase, partial [Candidatus Thiodiazotropha sp.]